MLTKKDAIAAGAFLDYIAKAPDADIVKALRKNTAAFKKLLHKIPSKKRDHRYAEGKWTIRELLQHIIDAERVFGYRALTTGRLDASAMPSFDENNWALSANRQRRKWHELVKEFEAVRRSTEYMFAALDEQSLLFQGNAGGKPINALAMGYVTAGHVQHHINVIKQRYL